MTASMEPDARAMLAHLEWLVLPALSVEPQFRVEIAWGEPANGPRKSRTFRITELDQAVRFVLWINRKGCNVYVGSTLKSADTPHKGRTTADKAAFATCLPVDSDTQFVATARQLAEIAKPQLLVVTGRLPETRGQLFVRIDPTFDLAAWETVHERIVRKCGGDVNALGRNRLMRLAGSISYPSPQKIARGYVVEQTSAHFVHAPSYFVPSLLAALPASQELQSAPAMQTILAGGGARRAKPPLRAVEAALRNLPDAYADQHRLWIKVGFALFDFDPSPSGLGLWQRFSWRCPKKAEETDFLNVWASIGRPYSGHRLTVSWLLREAQKPTLGA